MIADLLLLSGLVALTAYFVRKRSALRHSSWGYRAVIGGLGLACAAALADALFVGVNRVFEIPHLGATATHYTIIFGYFPGLVVIILGISRWLPVLERLDSEIAARKSAEEGLRRTEALLRDAIDSVSDAFIVFDKNDRLVLHNEKQSALFGSIADLLVPGARFEDLLRAQVERGQIDDAIGREEAWIAERPERHRNPQGEVIQHFAEGRVIRMAEQRTRQGGVVAVRTDISELFNARLSAERAAEAVRVLLETAPVPLAMVRGERLLFANKQMQDLLGVPLEQHVDSFGRSFMVDAAHYDTLLHRVATEGSVTGFDAAMHCAGGRQIWVTINAAPVNYQDGPAVFIGLLDITIRRDAERTAAENEARLRAIAEGIPLPLCITRIGSGQLLFANEPFKTTLGLTDSDIINRSVRDFFADPETIARQLEQMIADNAISGWSVEMKTKDGRRLSTTHSVRAITVGGEPALLGVFMDVSDQQRTQRELAEAKRAAEAANISKSQFLAVMSHELRTPLNAILGFSEVLRDQLFGPIGSPRYVDYAADIHNSGQHLLSLISDVLDLSRIEAGRLELHETELDPERMAREAIHYFEVKAYEHDKHLELHAETAGCRLHADERCLRQVLLNLLSNAVKFAETGSAIRLDVLLHDDGHLSFQVFNRGEGIAEADLERVMLPFAQLANAQARREHGTGLGLSITKHLMDAHGGSLELHSQLGRGTTAIASFPAERVVGAKSLAAVAAH